MLAQSSSSTRRGWPGRICRGSSTAPRGELGKQKLTNEELQLDLDNTEKQLDLNTREISRLKKLLGDVQDELETSNEAFRQERLANSDATRRLRAAEAEAAELQSLRDSLEADLANSGGAAQGHQVQAGLRAPEGTGRPGRR